MVCHRTIGCVSIAFSSLLFFAMNLGCVDAEENFAPVFLIQPNRTADFHVSVKVRNSMKLNCSVRAKPKATVTWFTLKKNRKIKFKEPLKNPFILDKIWDVDESMMCVVKNSVGEIRRKFMIRTRTIIHAAPLVADLKNITVVVGSTAQMICSAASDLPPFFLYQKWINNSIGAISVHDIPDFQGRIHTETRPPNSKTGFFKHYLTINATRLDDAGKYTCTVGNHFGIVRKTLYFSVKPITSKTTENVLAPFIAIVIAVVSAFVIVFIIIVAIHRRHLNRKMRKKEEEMRNNFEKEIERTPPHSPVRPLLLSVPSSSASVSSDVFQFGKSVSCGDEFAHVSISLDTKWEIDRQLLKIDGVLGEGAFGRVLRATAIGVTGLAEKQIVAIKTLKVNSTEAELMDLLSEMNMMKTIGRHKNIVNLIGCCTQEGPLFMVIEHAEFGNLRQFLRDRRPTCPDYLHQSSTDDNLSSLSEQRRSVDEDVMTTLDLISFSFQIARGMEYLESRKCVHRDLAARNILVSSGKVLKIADFGLARDIHTMDYYRKTTDGRLPVKWMAIEALFDRVYSSKSDVWGYGIVLWEIMTFGGTPYPSLPVEELFDLLKSGYRMEKPPNCPSHIYDTMVKCWAENPNHRPTFTELVETFDAILTDLVSDDYLDTGSRDCARLILSAATSDTCLMPVPDSPGVISNDSVFDNDHVYEPQSKEHVTGAWSRADHGQGSNMVSNDDNPAGLSSDTLYECLLANTLPRESMI